MPSGDPGAPLHEANGTRSALRMADPARELPVFAITPALPTTSGSPWPHRGQRGLSKCGISRAHPFTFPICQGLNPNAAAANISMTVGNQRTSPCLGFLPVQWGVGVH